MWKTHVRAQVKKRLRAQVKKRLRVLLSCNAFIGRAWGLSPKMKRWLYKRMIIPKITYAVVVWWYIMDIALARSELERLQTATCSMITGAMRTTPTKVLEMLLDLPTLTTAVESAAQMAAYHLPRQDLWNLGIGHNQIWAKADKVDSKFICFNIHYMIVDNVCSSLSQCYHHRNFQFLL